MPKEVLDAYFTKDNFGLLVQMLSYFKKLHKLLTILILKYIKILLPNIIFFV